MSIHYVANVVIPASESMLPPKMATPAARAMLLAIGLQESRFEYRRQISGPARGFWQFESGGGVNGVMNHASTKSIVLPILDTMKYAGRSVVYEALADNDILACVFARLLLWSHPRSLPTVSDPDGAWHYYMATWRPGKPHRHTWNDFYEQAWAQ